MITQFPAFKMFLVLKFNQFHSKFRGSLLLVFFSRGFCYISVHFDLAQVVFFFIYLLFFVSNHHHPRLNRLKNLEIPLSR